MSAEISVQEGVELSRLTTIGTGGTARAFARPATLAQLEAALAWARERGLAVATIGLGSNLLVADEGVEALVLRLAGELAAVRVEPNGVLVAGGGAPNAVSLHRARDAALGGFEFACAIPGTAGGGVWMNAGAYGSDWAQVLRRALVVGEGADWLDLEQLGLRYRHSELRHGQVVAQVEFQLEPKPPAEIKATIAELQARRKAAQPTNKRTFGSVFRNPEHELSAGRMLEACGLKGYRLGGALISPRHANFIENAGSALSADALALIVEARRRAREEFGVDLQHEVEFLGRIELPE